MASSPSLIMAHSYPTWLQITQSWIFNQVRHLPGDIEAHIICERTENLDQYDLPNIHVFGRRPLLTRLWEKLPQKLGWRPHLPFSIRTAKAIKAGLLHSHFGNVGWTDLPVAAAADLRHVVTFYGHDLHAIPMADPRWLDRYRELFSRADLFLCEGPHMGRCLVEMGCPAEKVQVNHLGVRVDEIPFSPRQWDGKGPLRVLMAASFREKKGIPYAIEALGEVSREIPIAATLIGDANATNPQSHEEKEKILGAIAKYGLADKVTLAGYQSYPEMLKAAYEHHIFLSPSVTAVSGDTEGGAPVALIDMAASGMPIISTTHCDIPEIVKHNETGLLAPERDVPSLVCHLRQLAAAPEDWEKMVTAGRRYMEAEFSAANTGEKLGGIYRRLV